MTWAESDLRDKMMRDDEYADLCPICDECKQQMTAEEYYYDVYDHIVCPNCMDRFIEHFKKRVESYVEDRRYR